MAAIALTVGGGVGFLIGRSTRDESRPLERAERPRRELTPPPPAPLPIVIAPSPKPDAAVPRHLAGRPNAIDVYSVPLGNSPVEGPGDALVTIVEFAEFACPFCKRVDDTLDELKKIYGNKLRIAWKHLIVHQATATKPAHATCAANRQGAFFRMQDKLWPQVFPPAGKVRDPAVFEHASLKKLAKSLGLDMQQFDLDLATCAADVDADKTLAQSLGVGATPSFFVNGRFLSGAQPIENFRALIDEEILKAEKQIAAGTPANSIYSNIVATGKTSP